MNDRTFGMKFEVPATFRLHEEAAIEPRVRYIIEASAPMALPCYDPFPGGRMRPCLIILFSSSALTGCIESSSTLSPFLDDRPAGDFMNGPEDPGPFIARDNSDPFFMLFDTDRATGLAVLIRLPAPGVTLIPCGGTTNLDESSLQLVFHANGAINQLMMGRGVQAFVYNRSTFVAALIAGGLCNAIATQVPIASGLVDFNAHDNDTFLSGAHADAFGWSARGLMTSSADGSLLRFQNTSHGVLGADGTLIHFVNSISLTPRTGS